MLFQQAIWITAAFEVRATLCWAWYLCKGKNCCPKECTACTVSVGDGVENRLLGRPMELLQHVKPQPSHLSSVVHGGAKRWWSVSLLVHCALPLFVWLCVMGDASCPRRTSLARLCPGSPCFWWMWGWHVQPLPAACGQAWCFGDITVGLEKMMFCSSHSFLPFPLARAGCLLEDKDEQCLGAVAQGSGQCSSGTPGEAHWGW